MYLLPKHSLALDTVAHLIKLDGCHCEGERPESAPQLRNTAAGRTTMADHTGVATNVANETGNDNTAPARMPNLEMSRNELDLTPQG